MRDSNGLKKYLIGVAVTVTTGLLLQTCAFIWWASSITTRVDRNERDIRSLIGHSSLDMHHSPNP